MGRIIQSNNGSGYACAVAMETNSNEAEVFDFCEHDGKDTDFTDFEMCSFLLKKGFILGYIFDPGTIHKNNMFVNFKFNLRDSALIFVEPKQYKMMKSVIYWDGNKVYDPATEANPKWLLKAYNIRSWCVLTKIDIIKRFKKNRFRDVE